VLSLFLQVLIIGMIFFVGAVSENPRHVSWGLWTIFGTTALGALIAGQNMIINYNATAQE
jgi:hypothetical protein